MTIEKSSAAAESKPASASEAKGASGKGGPNGKTNGAGLGGFMAILAAVDTSSVTASVAPEDALPVGLSDGTNSGLGLDAQGNPLASLIAPMAPADLLNQANQLLSNAAVPTSELVVPAVPAAVQIQIQVQVPRSPAADARAGAVAPVAQAADYAAPVLRKPAKGPLDMDAKGPAGSAPELPGSLSTNAATESRAAATAPKVEVVVQAAQATPAALAAAANPPRRDEDTRDHSIFKPTVTEAVAMPSATTFGVSPTSFANPVSAASPLDVYVAEQVKYWISNDVKNAEMKLDGIGMGPVEVSISMQGNEAHVAFRTDEPQARQVLECASDHLKDMLQREGVMLSGVSVGTAGAGNPGEQERKGRQGVRHTAAVAAIQSAQPAGPSSASRTSGRALDLFV